MFARLLIHVSRFCCGAAVAIIVLGIIHSDPNGGFVGSCLLLAGWLFDHTAELISGTDDE